MSIFHFLLDVYFAATLGIAGIAKIDSPEWFMSALRYQHRFPEWSISKVGRIFPWIEILLAVTLLLTINFYKLMITTIIFVIFIFFLILNIKSALNRASVANCGCFGRALRQRNLYSSSATSFIQVVLAASLISLALWTSPLGWRYYFISGMLFIGVYIWLLWRTWERHQLATIADAKL